MTTPIPVQVPLWTRSQRWLRFAEALVRYYTNRGGRASWALHLLAPGSDASAWANPATRTIGLNPRFEEASGRLADYRRGPLSEQGRTEMHLRAYLAHEAGHVRFSCARPAGRLGELWNALEDQRIERRMAARHAELAQAFRLVGDVHLQRLSYECGGDLGRASLLDWPLIWRWGHDHPLMNDRPADARWPQVRALTEAAWAAPSSEAVIEIARELLALLDVDPDETGGEKRTSATGGGSDEREETPGRTGPQRAGERGPQDEAGEEASGDEQPENGAGQDGESEAGKAEGPGGNDSGEKQPGEGEEHGPGGKASEEQEEQEGQGDAGTDVGGQEGAPEDEAVPANPQAPADLIPDAPAPPASQPAAGAGCGPRLGAAAPPDLLLHSHEALARDLAGLMEARDQRGMETTHRSRGRFDYGRFVAGSERYFRTRTRPTRQEPVRVTVLADVSGSTSGNWHGRPCVEGVRFAALALTRAGMLARQAAVLATFSSRTELVSPPGLTPSEAYGRVLAHRFVPDGGTMLAPALRLALARRTPGARHLVVVISDGALNDQDECAALLRGHGTQGDTAFLPLLVNTTPGTVTQWRALFPGARPARDVRELGFTARAVLTHLQGGVWRAPLDGQ